MNRRGHDAGGCSFPGRSSPRSHAQHGDDHYRRGHQSSRSCTKARRGDASASELILQPREIRLRAPDLRGKPSAETALQVRSVVPRLQQITHLQDPHADVRDPVLAASSPCSDLCRGWWRPQRLRAQPCGGEPRPASSDEAADARRLGRKLPRHRLPSEPRGQTLDRVARTAGLASAAALLPGLRCGTATGEDESRLATPSGDAGQSQG
jgi:hypothetical protein